MALVLVLDDEPDLRRLMAGAIGTIPAVTVVEAATFAEALAHLEAAPPDVVVADIDLPDRSGLEIIGELDARGCSAPVVFVSAYLANYSARIPRGSRIDVREKPIRVDDLRDLVQRRLDARASQRAALPFELAEVLQLAHLGRRSVRFEIARGATPLGQIAIVAGELHSAADERGRGEDAFIRLLTAPETHFTVATTTGPPPVRDVHRGLEQLLLDVAVAVDEANRDAGTTSAGFEAAFDRAIDALLTKDFKAALRAFEEADRLRPGDGQVQANLARLRELGVEDSDETAT